MAQLCLLGVGFVAGDGDERHVRAIHPPPKRPNTSHKPHTHTPHSTALAEVKAKESEAAARIARLQGTLATLGVPLPPAKKKKGEQEQEEEEIDDDEEEEEMEVDPAMASLPVDVRQRCVCDGRG